MNKTELIEHIAKRADISKAAAARALDATLGAVKTTLKKAVQLPWLALAHLQLANAQPAKAEILALAQKSRSRQQKFQNSVLAKH